MHRKTFLLTGVVSLFWGAAALAQEAKHEVLRTADGMSIHITYYPFKAGKDSSGGSAENAPVVVLLHGEKESRLIWDKGAAPRDQDPFPLRLQNNGYAVVTVDLRRHGESVAGGETALRPADYNLMVASDLAAVKRFLMDQHQQRKLNMNKLALVGVGMSVPVAAAFAEADWKAVPYDDAPLPIDRTPRGQDVRALVMISPELSVGQLSAPRAITFLRRPMLNLALLVVVGADDDQDKGQAQKLFDAFASANKGSDRMEILSPKVKNRGISLMTNGLVYQSVERFLDTRLKAIDSPWRDRRSRLER